MHKKQTAWKKSRKFGDVYGGRSRPKLSDNIFRRCHSLDRPGPLDELPILIEDNPSRNFFHPISAEEAREAMMELPKRDYKGITHIWCRKLSEKEWRSRDRPMAQFICGSGVRVVVLYAWPRDMTMNYGSRRPENSHINELARYGTKVEKRGMNWIAEWQPAALRKYYISALLYHEIGHHIDWYYRLWSGANKRQTEDFADQYAIEKTATATYVFNRLQKRVDGSGAA